MNELMSMGVKLMGYGLIGTFTVLAAFIVMINVLVRIFSEK